MSGQKRSHAAEDFLKAVLECEHGDAPATTTRLAERLGVAAPTATAMAKRLDEQGLVEHTPYQSVVLTARGRLIALEVLRHHRLVERYLVESLGMSLDEVHAEAELLEHVLSDAVEDRIDALLGFPTHDPHGDPIPDRNLRLVESDTLTLPGLAEGQVGTVTRVPDGDSDVLRYLQQLGLVPGAPVEIVMQAPFGGPVTVRTGGQEHALARELAASIGVAAA